MRRKKKATRRISIFFIILFGLILPAILVIFGVLLFRKTSPPPAKIEDKEIKAEEAGVLKPSAVLNSQAKYARQNLILRGKLVAEEVVCERKECPEDDPCCGCEDKKDLILIDADASILSEKAKARLYLFEKERKSLCQKIPGTCDYDCSDWQMGKIYNVEGTFFSEAPPPGWGRSLDFYFMIKDKELAEQQVVGRQRLENFLDDFKSFFKKLKTSGYYVLD